jgi:trehalose 6-phosphate phosphatase
MPYLFNHLDSVEKLLSLSPLGLFTDLDGTISETAPSPTEARVSPLCRRHLSSLREHLGLVVVVSGRPAKEVKEMVGLEKVVYIGNHGLEQWRDGEAQLFHEAEAYSAIIETLLKELSPLLEIEGITFENKGVTASIHYRKGPNPPMTRKSILTALENSPTAKGLRLLQGRKVIDVCPPVERNKGSAVLELVQSHRLEGGIYLGDDLTDVDAFKAMHSSPTGLSFQGIAIGVTSEETFPEVYQEADFTLNGVGDVERFLGWLARTFD